MKTICFHILLIALIFNGCYCKLQFVIEMFRHGNQFILGLYNIGAKQASTMNRDIWNSKDFQEPGELIFLNQIFLYRLTPVGMRQHYILGQKVRNYYIKNQSFVSEYYYDKHFNIRSTDYNRTLQSAFSHLYGLFPLGTGPQLPRGINHSLTNPPYVNCSQIDPEFLASDAALPDYFQPICVHTVKKEHDTLLLPFTTKACPGAAKIQAQLRNTSFYSQVWQIIKPTCKSVAQKIGYTEQLEAIYDCAKIMQELDSEKYVNWKLPSLNSTEQKVMEFAMNIDLYIELYQTQEAISFAATPMIQTIVRLFIDSITQSNKDLQWQIFSAHDPTIAFMLAALNLTSSNCILELFMTNKTSSPNCISNFPQFASNLFIELYKNDTTNNTYYVKVRYNGKYYQVCQSGSYECDYNQFILSLSNQILPNWTQACGSNVEFTESGIHHRDFKNFYDFLNDAKIIKEDNSPLNNIEDIEDKQDFNHREQQIKNNQTQNLLQSEEVQAKLIQGPEQKIKNSSPSKFGIILNVIMIIQFFAIFVFLWQYFGKVQNVSHYQQQGIHI